MILSEETKVEELTELIRKGRTVVCVCSSMFEGLDISRSVVKVPGTVVGPMIGQVSLGYGRISFVSASNGRLAERLALFGRSVMIVATPKAWPMRPEDIHTIFERDPDFIGRIGVK